MHFFQDNDPSLKEIAIILNAGVAFLAELLTWRGRPSNRRHRFLGNRQVVWQQILMTCAYPPYLQTSFPQNFNHSRGASVPSSVLRLSVSSGFSEAAAWIQAKSTYPPLFFFSKFSRFKVLLFFFFFVFVNMGPYGSKNFKTLLPLQFSYGFSQLR